MASNEVIYKGLELLRPHLKGTYSLHGEHDILYVNTVFDSEEETPEEIRKAFEDTSWHWSSDCDCWAVFT